jgi:D-alanyl-lipoteichoic acid acyltransferase DltB (MBOAT superfamily)
MTLTHIIVFCIGAMLYSAFLPPRWRGWTLLIVSAITVYWLQPPLTIYYLDFILPTATLVIAVILWLITKPPDAAITREDRITTTVLIALVIGLSLTRYLAPELRPTASRAPDTVFVALALLLIVAVVIGVGRGIRRWSGLLTASILAILVIFTILKTEPLALGFSRSLRGLTGQDQTLAVATDLGWLGFSYIAFRLIHTVRERQTGKLPALTLREYVTYVVFFPALTAGPIDRAERYVKDDRALAAMTGLAAPRYVEGGTRILIGIFKKFVIADSLTLLALNDTNAGQVTSTLGMWALLYGYAFRLFFDFSGYSDIAIGIGILFGIHLPENFDRPYLKQSITAFWQSWHMTLSNWARFYVFSPLSRYLLTRKRKPSATVVVLICQLATMIAIGLWHGVSWNFVVWGAWHGVGLYGHKLWSDRTRRWYLSLKDRPRTRRLWTIAGVLITFHFVLLGWVWFALTDVQQAGTVFLRLFGIGA